MTSAEYLDVPVSVSLIVGAVSCFGWTALYLALCKLRPQKCGEWHCREVTALHAVTVVSLSAWCGFVQGPWPFTDPGGPSTPLQHLTVNVVFGYFIFDLIWCLYSGTEGLFMLFHHCLSITGCLIVLFRGTCGAEMIATIFGSEITNPLLQTRWFLRKSGLHKTWYAELNDAAFMLLFGFMRILVASYLLYCEWQHPRPDLVAKIGGTAIYSVGWVFWFKIVGYAVRKYSKILRSWHEPRASPLVTNGSYFHGDKNANHSPNGENASIRDNGLHRIKKQN